MVDSSEAGIVAYYDGKAINRSTFLSHVALTRRLLPKHQYSINICENRYHFLVLFAACMSLKQISLLPSSRADKDVEGLRKFYEDSYLADDDLIREICKGEISQTQIDFDLQVESDQMVAMVFTSGTTGTPKPNAKTWRQLVENAKRVKKRFEFNAQQQHSVVATVPPQHMFGFETTIVYPLISGIAIHAGRPFYPLDIQKALSETPSPRMLVTTPLHLKTCLSKEEEWPDIDFVISATAKMPLKTATEAEKVLNTRVFEIYGCSEVGAIATRQMSVNTAWHLLPDFEIFSSNKATLLKAPGYKERILIPDYLDAHDKYFFKLVSRNSDLINIGGKRGSIIDLTNKLRGIEGVIDAVIFMRDEEDGKRSRLAAFAVAPDFDEKGLRHILAKYIDAIFLPRPLIILQQLPYNELGKLPRASLLWLLNQHLNKPFIQEKL